MIDKRRKLVSIGCFCAGVLLDKRSGLKQASGGIGDKRGRLSQPWAAAYVASSARNENY